MDPQNFVFENIGGLNAYIRQGNPKLPCIVNLHGYKWGALDFMKSSIDIENDMFRGVCPFRVSPTWVFPEAPFVFNDPVNYSRRCSWFKMRGSFNNAERVWYYEIPADINESLPILDRFLDALDYPLENVILAGFNQGAIMALEYVLHQTEHVPLGVAVIMGHVINPETVLKVELPFNFVWIHSPEDPYFSIDPIRKRVDELINQGCQGSLKETGDYHYYTADSQCVFFDFIYERLKDINLLKPEEASHTVVNDEPVLEPIAEDSLIPPDLVEATPADKLPKGGIYPEDGVDWETGMLYYEDHPLEPVEDSFSDQDVIDRMDADETSTNSLESGDMT